MGAAKFIASIRLSGMVGIQCQTMDFVVFEDSRLLASVALRPSFLFSRFEAFIGFGDSFSSRRAPFLHFAGVVNSICDVGIADARFQRLYCVDRAQFGIELFLNHFQALLAKLAVEGLHVSVA